MKIAKYSLTWFAVVAVALAFVASAGAETAKTRTGKIVRIKGAARYSTGNNVWQPLKVGAILKPGAVVQTAKDSFVDIVLNEEASASSVTALSTASAGPAKAGAGGGGGGGSVPSVDQDVVRVLEDSLLSIDKLSAVDNGADTVTETELDLRAGAVFGAIKKQAASSRFEVKVPNGVAGVRGTFFSISASGILAVLKGSLVAAFTDAAGNVATQIVGAGFQFNTKTGELSPLPSSVLRNLTLLANECGYGNSGHGHGDHGGHGGRGDEYHPVSPHR